MVAVFSLCVFVAAGFSADQQRLYEGTAEVLLNRADLSASLTGSSDALATQDADRSAQTQVQLAAVPAVAQGALKRVPGAKLTVPELLRNAHVTVRANSDVLAFSVRDSRPAVARTLATAYARSFGDFRRNLDTVAIGRARAGLKKRIDIVRSENRARNRARGTAYESLLQKDDELATIEALKTSNAVLVRTADTAVKVQPKVTRNLLVGLLLGLVAAIALAFTREALDTRIRSAEDVERHLELPLLARIPAPPRKLQATNSLLMLKSPNHPQAEVFRLLRTSLEFAKLEREIKSIMVTSAGTAEGKSVTVANLALTMARAGQRVVLVDLDLRRPMLDRLFHTVDRLGITSVVLGQAALDEALVTISLTGADPTESGGGESPVGLTGRLELLTSGPQPPDPGEFVGTHALANTLSLLEQRADIVLIDAPPSLHVGDALTLSNRVDGIIVVTRANKVRRPMLVDMKRLLTSTPGAVLGFVLTDATLEDGYGYGYGYGYDSGNGKRSSALADSPAKDSVRS